jgi:hypothetical protein
MDLLTERPTWSGRRFEKPSYAGLIRPLGILFVAIMGPDWQKATSLSRSTMMPDFRRMTHLRGQLRNLKAHGLAQLLSHTSMFAKMLRYFSAHPEMTAKFT